MAGFRARPGPSFWPTVVVVIALGLASASVAIARQPALPAGLEDAFHADFLRRDLALMDQELQLDDGQRAIVQSLFADYEEAFGAGADTLRGRLNQLHPEMSGGDPEMERRRQEVRDRIAALVQENQQAMENMEDAEQAENLRDQLRTRLIELRRELRDLQPPPLDARQFEMIEHQAHALVAEWRTGKAQLRGEFVAGLLAALNDEQRPRWAGVERTLRRQKTLPRGRLSGESVDLILLVKETAPQLAATEPLNSVLHEYELRLDEGLRQRDEYIASSQSDLQTAVTENQADDARTIIERQMDMRAAVRNINDDFSRRVAAELPEELALEFSGEFRRRAYPTIFRSTRAERAFKAAEEMADADSDTHKAILELHLAYQTELGVINEELLAAVRTHEPKQLVERMQVVAARLSDGQTGKDLDQIALEFARREKLDARYLSQLESVIGPEEFKRLPGVGTFAEGGDRLDDRGVRSVREMIRRFDTDGDGRLSPEEKAALKESLLNKEFPPVERGSEEGEAGDDER